MMTALVRCALVLAFAAVLVVATAFAPIALRSISGFRVQRVEVNGVRYLTAAAAVDAAGIGSASNVFDDPAVWLERLRAHALVADVRITRRLPGTLVLHIEEAVPVAFARTPELRAIGSHGRVMPLDPADEGLDLPVLTERTRVSGLGHAVDPATRTILGFLAEVRRVDPGLIDWISEIGMHGDAVRLVLRSAADAEVYVSAAPAADRLRRLSATLAELATPRVVPSSDGTAARSAEAELARVSRIDVRFHDQVVVSMRKGKS